MTSGQTAKLFDRQAQIFGQEVQSRILTTNVFVTPLSPVNAEIAKNLVLQGFNVTLFDKTEMTHERLQKNVLLGADSESQFGHRRDQLVQTVLKQISSLADVSVVNDISEPEALAAVQKCQIAVLAPESMQEWLQISAIFEDKFEGEVFVTIWSHERFVCLFGNKESALWGPKLVESLHTAGKYCQSSLREMVETFECGGAVNKEAEIPFILSSVFGSVVNQTFVSWAMAEKREQRAIVYDPYGASPDHSEIGLFMTI